jgi:large subunit ribosomal protein L46
MVETLYKSYRTNNQKAAERILVKSGGVNMNTWVIGNAPVGHHQHDYLHEASRSSQNSHQGRTSQPEG